MKKLLCAFLLLTVRLLAVNPVPYTESMSFSFKINGTGSSSINIYDETGTQYMLATASGSWIESGTGTAWMIPGKTYTLQFWGLGPPDYKMSFIAPTGYAVFVNGVETNLVSYSPGTSWHLEYYKIELRPSMGEGGGKWGQFSGIKLGKAISWGVGLGDLRTGRSAGGIQFRQPDLSGGYATRDLVFYASPPANVGQIVVIYDGPSNSRLRQICTPIGFTDLVDVTGGYEMRFYYWNQAGWNGSMYTFTGSPWKTIKVEAPATNQLKITETQGALVRVSLLTGSGATTETGGTITYSGGKTLHTFTSSGTLTLSSAHSGVSWLVIGGGGGGGFGGGGAGSMEYLTGQSIASGSYAVTVGAGGASETNGSNSTFNGTTAYGGGRGAGGTTAPGSGGSSGGGCANNNTGAPPTYGSGSNIHWGGGGDNGGNGWRGGGGGGAGGDGLGLNNSSGAIQGTGGPGLANSITGSSVFYAGGGAGNNSTPLSGGSGGGGDSNGSGQTGSAGAPNTGSGGGGGDNGTSASGGAGGSGVVIVSYPTSTMILTLQEGDGTTWLRTTVHTSSIPASGQRDDVVVVRTGGSSGTIVAKTKYHYVNQAWGEELDSVIADPDGDALTTTYTYHTNSANLGNYRRVQSVTSPTGGWTAYDYYDDWDHRGQLKYRYQPWLDSPSTASSASTTTGHVFYYEYAADWTGRYTRPLLREERINNVLVGKTTWSHGDNTGSGEPRAYATVNSYSDSTHCRADYAESYRADADPDFAGHPYLAQGADQTQTAGSVSRGTFDNSTKVFTVGSTGDHWRELTFHGSTSSTGADSVTTFDSQTCPAVYLIPNKSTLDVTIRIAQGYVYRTETWVYTGGGSFSLLTYEDFTYDATGHLIQRLASNGAMATYSYTDGLLSYTVAADGTRTDYTYDELWRVHTAVKAAATGGSYATQPAITTTYTCDGANHVIETVVSGGTHSLTSDTSYDLAGRVTQTVAPGGYTTGYGYSSGGRITTVTLPGGGTKVTATHLDGQIKSLTGTSVVAQYHTYAVDSGTGMFTRQVNSASATSASWVKTATDWLGRKTSEVKPGWSGSDVTCSWNYDSHGQLVQTTQPGMAATLYTYDTLGNLVLKGLDIGGNGSLDLASTDRITRHDWEYFSSSGWWLRQTTSTYATDNNGTATVIGKTETRLSGFASGQQAFSKSYDVFGNVTTQSVDVNRTGKLVTTTTDTSDSSTDAVKVTYNGLVVSATDTVGVQMTYGYDDLGRQVTVTDPRTGTTTTAYKPGTSQVDTVTDPASVVQSTYAYDSAGRVSSVKDAFNKSTRYDYNARGQKTHVWGEATYPVEYGYDDWGRMVLQKTYRNATGLDQSTWAGVTPGTADLTKWVFDEGTGFLKEKYDAANLDSSGNPITGAKKVAFTYKDAGQIETRTWARGVTTTYSYYGGTGEVHTQTYSDSTPGVTYTYDRVGDVATAADGTGTRTHTYNLSGTLELQYTDLPSFYDSRRLTYGYDTATGVKGRLNAFQVGTSSNATADQSVAYGYQTDGRLSTVGAGGQTFTYGYQTNSHLLATVGNAGLDYLDTRSYDSDHDWVSGRTTTWGSSPVTKAAFAYTRDDLGRVTKVGKTGQVFSRYGTPPQGLDTSYDYDDRSQLTSEVTKLGGTSTVLTGRNNSSFTYDTIGNRDSVTHNGHTSTYYADALNRYTQRTVPGYFDVAGAASSGATVTVDGSSAGVTRHGEYFFKDQALTNTSAVYTALTISDGSTSFDLDAFLPATPESFSYDDDGNLTSDGRWDYTYDAENRLVVMQTHTALSPSPFPNADARRLEFTYDHQGRRVEKLVRAGYNGTVYTTVISDQRFLYQGWNCVASIDVSSGNIVQNFYWGLDLSGSAQGAGGIGGLLMIQDSDTTYLPAYDAMGNLHALMTASAVTLGSTTYAAGDIVAAYEYDAFGQTLRETGGYAASNPFRFSTKYTDIETSLVYYGHRYYSPSLGRFQNRDPIEEQGGLNLYSFCLNNAVNSWDYLGNWTLGDGEWYAQATPQERDEYYNMLEAYQGGTEFMAAMDAARTSVSGIWIFGSSATAASSGDFSIASAARAAEAEQQANDWARIMATPGSWSGLSMGSSSTKKESVSAGNLGYMDENGNWHEIPGTSTNFDGTEKVAPSGASSVSAPNNTATHTVTVQSYIGASSAGPFLGDGRGPSTSPSSAYRTSSTITVDPANPSSSGTVTSSTGVTVAILPGPNGPIVLTGHASSSGLTGNSTYVSPGIVRVNLSGSAANPLVPGAPPITYNTSVSINFNNGTFAGGVTRTDFPSFQIFVDGQPIYNSTEVGTATNLYDTTFVPIKGTLPDPNK